MYAKNKAAEKNLMNNSETVLIVDDNEMMVKTLRDILKVKGHQTEVAYSAQEALEKLKAQDFVCVLSDIKMPGISGVELYRSIKTKQPDLPVVLMTAYSTDTLIKEGLEEGVIAVLTKPLNLSLLLNFLSFLRRERSIVIVDDDPDFCKTLGDILAAQDFVVKQITNPEGIVEKISAREEVILLDMKLDQVSGLDVLQQIRARYPDLPVVLVTGHKEEVSSAIEAALKISAHTCFYKPFEIEALLKTLTEIYHNQLGKMLGQPHRRK